MPESNKEVYEVHYCDRFLIMYSSLLPVPVNESCFGAYRWGIYAEHTHRASLHSDKTRAKKQRWGIHQKENETLTITKFSIHFVEIKSKHFITKLQFPERFDLFTSYRILIFFVSFTSISQAAHPCLEVQREKDEKRKIGIECSFCSNNN